MIKVKKSLRNFTIQKSIEHWERLLKAYDNKDKQGLVNEGWQIDSCSLCVVYYTYSNADNEYGGECASCPIVLKHGVSFEHCYNTPYGGAAASIKKGLREGDWGGREKIQEEIAFLKDLKETE